MSTNSSRSLGPISHELGEVLYRTRLINSYRGKEFDISSTTTLLGFTVSKTPWGTWLRLYMAARDISINNLMRSRKIHDEILPKVAHHAIETGERTWRLTPFMNRLFDEALKLLLRVGGPEQLDERHLLAAFIYCSEGREKQLTERGFDRVAWSNDFLEEVALKRPEELSQWAQIHLETFGSMPDVAPGSAAVEKDVSHSEVQKPSDAPEQSAGVPTPQIHDQTQVLLDGPAIHDSLGRKYLAETLAVRMNRTWERYRNQNLKGSFMLHIHGAWGSGKSSLLNFLKVELQPRATEQLRGLSDPVIDDDSLDWIVVDFNAWQRQHIEPPWWSLIDTIYNQACTQLKTSYGEHAHAWNLKARERWWRFTTGRRDHLIAMLISFLFLAGVIVWRNITPSNLTFDLKSVATVVGLVGGVWSTLLLVSRSLISGSSQSAQAFMQRSGDPMERVSKHFVDLLEWIDKPVVIFIDDLDRCQTNYVVTLLEGIQTLFNHPRAVYVIAADRRWLHVSFEKLYENFADAVKEPGRRLGSLFLEKAFEASISVPRMSPERRKLYFGHLLGSQTSVQEIDTIAREAQGEFKNDKDEAAVLSRLGTGTGNPLRDEIRKGAAVRQLANQQVAESTESFLQSFVGLTEPNPRAMKRLVNAYTLLRDIAVLGGSNLLFDYETRKQLALWSIVSLRWPLLKEQLEVYLEEHSDDEEDAVELICKGASIPFFGPELDQLARSREVGRVFRGEGIGTGLDKKTICSLVGISAAEPKSGGVA